MRKTLYYIFGLTAIYFFISLVGILHHEIWLDEGHHWLLARDSSSFSELVYNTRYEGHPILWSILLFITTRFTHDVFWMQFIHIIISSLTIFIFLKKAPFNIIFKVLFIFGYFMLFEYTLISRNYMLGILFIFLALSFYEKRESKFFIFCLFLTLASNAHLLFFIIASIILFFTAIEQFRANKLFKKRFIVGYSLFFIGSILLTIQIIPPADSTFFESINNLTFFERTTKGYISLWNGLICIPDFRSIHFWNTNIFIHINKPITAIFGLLIYGLPFLLFYKNKNILLYVYTSLIGMQVFFFITQRGNARSEGIVFLIFIIALWIEKYMQQNPIKIINNIKHIRKLKTITIYSILCIHFFSGAIAYSMDYNHPFTPAKAVADYTNKNYTNKIIITDFWDNPVSSYKKSPLYSLCMQDYKSFNHWNTKCKIDVYNSNEKRFDALSAFLKNQKTSCIYITFMPITTLDLSIEKTKNIQIKFLKRLEKNIIPNREYTIYEVKYIN